MEPSDMYVRDQFVDSAHIRLYECYQSLARKSLYQIIELTKKRIEKDANDAGHLLDILEGKLMPIQEDTVYEKYALPLARRIQAIPSSDPYIKIFAVDDEFVILKKLKRNDEALKVAKKNYEKFPNVFTTNVGMGRAYSATGDYKKALTYIKAAQVQSPNDMNKTNIEVMIKKLQEGKDIN